MYSNGNTLNPGKGNGAQYESPSIVSMNSNTTNTTASNQGTPNSSGALSNEVSEVDNNSDADLLTPDSCLSETSYLMNLFHPNNRLDNSRFDRPEVKALKEKAAQRVDNTINGLQDQTRKRKKSNSALGYFEDQSGRKYSNPIARPKINRNNMVAGAAAALQRLSNASSGTNNSGSNSSAKLSKITFLRFVCFLLQFCVTF